MKTNTIRNDIYGEFSLRYSQHDWTIDYGLKLGSCFIIHSVKDEVNERFNHNKNNTITSNLTASFKWKIARLIK